MEQITGSARLFAAFENIGISPGADLRSPFGPSGNPAESMIRAFDEAMMAPAQGTDTIPGAATPGSEYGNAQPTLNLKSETMGEALPPPTVAGPAERLLVPGSNPAHRPREVAQPELSTQNAQKSSPMQDAGTVQSPVELYQAQYQLGLLRAHMTTTLQSSQSLTQSLETALKQSG